MNKHTRLLIAMLLGLVLMVANGHSAAADEKPRVRVVHAAPSLSPLDIFVNDILFFDKIPYRYISDYAPIDPGDRTVRVILADPLIQNPTLDGQFSEGGLNAIRAEATLREVSEAFENDRHYTVIVSGRLRQLEYWRITDDNVLPGNGTARVRFVHAAVNTPSTEFCLGDVCRTISFKQASDYFLLDPGTYTPNIRLNGKERTKLVIRPLVLQNNGVHTVFLTGEIQDQPQGLQLLYTLDNSEALAVPYPKPPPPAVKQPPLKSGAPQAPAPPGSLTGPAPAYPPVSGAFLSIRAIGLLAGLGVVVAGGLGFWLAHR
ncbi:MAG TPA: DUF4397 domain-containing protein [Anaerolineae bacterium]|nr:DUF4397 domain-containing protein [Anaerolineae bacterium]